MGTPGNELGKIVGTWFKKNSTKVLTGTAIAGTACTGYFAWKARPAADMALAKAEQDKGSSLTRWEKFKIAFPYYIPAFSSFAVSSGSVIAAEATNTNIQRGLSSALTAANASYTMYRTASAKVYGEDAVQKIDEEVLQTPENWAIVDQWYGIYSETKIGSLDTEERLFYDDYSCKIFRSTLGKVQDAMAALNHECLVSPEVPLAKWYDFLGILDQYGEASRDIINELSWSTDALYENTEIPEIGFACEKRKRPDETDIIVIRFVNMPAPDSYDLDYELYNKAPSHLDDVLLTEKKNND